MTYEDRFWSKVLVAGDCWLWTGCKCRDGYGRTAPAPTGATLAHRVAYELIVGTIPPGLTLDHLCRVRACVNPAHLEAVTQGENARRGTGGQVSAAHKRALTHCKHGHEFTEANTYIRREGRRICRACARERKRKA